MKMRRTCRLWWPSHLSSTQLHSSAILFGWCISSSSASLDIVVAFACDKDTLASIQSGLQGILHETNGNMPMSLQDKCTISMLGYCALDSSSNGESLRVGPVEDTQINSTNGNLYPWCGGDMLNENYKKRSCGCYKFDGLLEQCRHISIEKSNWIELVCGSYEHIGRKVRWIPKLHHIHWAGQTVAHLDLHVIVYESPRFGGHHFSMGFWNSSELVKTPLKKPKWVEDLHQKQPQLDLDTVILAINSATAAKLLFEELVLPKSSTIGSRIVCMIVTFTWQLLAMSMASYSTLFYIILQFLHNLLSYGSESCIYITLAKLFTCTWKSIRLRSCQILYWPISLHINRLRSGSCVEYAEKAASRKHSMWSSVAVDVLVGNLFGIVLLFHAESVCLWVSNFANDITNYLLRMGCVWLMGNPAGFKLNTELAGVLGMVSLHAIQIWSTLWFYMGFLFIYFIKGIAISGVIFGLTTPAALVVDMISVATMHVWTLHWVISLFYSHQIQSIAALWRLFRGQKLNPLRQRLDSYDYTVEQHIIGSLLFTPLLLLLPTTSAFYIFFTIVNTSISFICSVIEVAISVIHATPYTKIFLCLVRPRRFPSGIWFEIISRHNDAIDFDENGSSSEVARGRIDTSGSSRCSVLVSFLRSNSLSIGQIVWPHYKHIYSVVSRSSIASSAYAVLSGRSIPTTLGTGLPSKMPWMSIPYKDYWCLCRDAVLSCKPDF